MCNQSGPQAAPAVNASGKTGGQEGWGVQDHCEGIKPEEDRASFKFKPCQEPAHRASISTSFCLCPSLTSSNKYITAVTDPRPEGTLQKGHGGQRLAIF